MSLGSGRPGKGGASPLRRFRDTSVDLQGKGEREEEGGGEKGRRGGGGRTIEEVPYIENVSTLCRSVKFRNTCGLFDCTTNRREKKSHKPKKRSLTLNSQRTVSRRSRDLAWKSLQKNRNIY